MARLKQVELCNFKNFSTPQTIELWANEEDCAFSVIVGRNGSGKSCLCEAIEWVLFNPTNKALRAKKSSELVNKSTSCQSMYVELEFFKPSTRDKIIIRKSYDGKSTKIATDVTHSNGQAHGQKGIHAAQTALESIGIHREHYERMIVKQNACSIVRQSPKELLNFMERLIGTHTTEQTIANNNLKINETHQRRQAVTNLIKDAQLTQQSVSLKVSQHLGLLREELKGSQALEAFYQQKVINISLTNEEHIASKQVTQGRVDERQLSLQRQHEVLESSKSSKALIQQQIERQTRSIEAAKSQIQKHNSLLQAIHDEIQQKQTELQKIKKQCQSNEKDILANRKKNDKIEKDLNDIQQKLASINLERQEQTAGTSTGSEHDKEQEDMKTAVGAYKNLVQQISLQKDNKTAVAMAKTLHTMERNCRHSEATHSTNMHLTRTLEKQLKAQREQSDEVSGNINSSTKCLQQSVLSLQALRHKEDVLANYLKQKRSHNKEMDLRSCLQKYDKIIENVKAKQQSGPSSPSNVFGMLHEVLGPCDIRYEAALLAVYGNDMYHTIVVTNRETAVCVSKLCRLQGLCGLTVLITDESSNTFHRPNAPTDAKGKGQDACTPLMNTVTCLNSSVEKAVAAKLASWKVFEGNGTDTLHHLAPSSGKGKKGSWGNGNVVSLDGCRFFQDGEIRTSSSIHTQHCNTSKHTQLLSPWKYDQDGKCSSLLHGTTQTACYNAEETQQVTAMSSMLGQWTAEFQHQSEVDLGQHLRHLQTTHISQLELSIQQNEIEQKTLQRNSMTLCMDIKAMENALELAAKEEMASLKHLEALQAQLQTEQCAALTHSAALQAHIARLNQEVDQLIASCEQQGYDVEQWVSVVETQENNQRESHQMHLQESALKRNLKSNQLAKQKINDVDAANRAKLKSIEAKLVKLSNKQTLLYFHRSMAEEDARGYEMRYSEGNFPSLLYDVMTACRRNEDLLKRTKRKQQEDKNELSKLQSSIDEDIEAKVNAEACLEEASASLSRQLQSVSSICISYPSISQCWKDTPEHDHLHESVTHPEDTHTPVTHPQDDTHNTSAHRNTLHISNRNNFAENFPFDLPQPPAYHCTSTSMLDQLTQRLQKSRRKLQAVAEDSQWANYHQLTQDIATLQADEAHFRLEMVSYQTTNNCLQSDRTVKVLTALRTIQHHINRTYQFLTVNGNCHLHYAKDSLSLFEEGLTLQVQQHQHGLATWLPTSKLSGGQIATCGITLLMSIQDCLPSPIYIMDEVDASLDTQTVCRVGLLLRDKATPMGAEDRDPEHQTEGGGLRTRTELGHTHGHSSQLVLVSHRPEMILSASRLVGVYGLHHTPAVISHPFYHITSHTHPTEHL